MTVEESASIFPLNPENLADFQRYKKLDRSPEVQKWMIGEETTDEELKKYLASHPEEVLIYAISGEKSGGKMEGWLQLVPEEEERIERIRKLNLANIPEDHAILELSYARYKDSKLSEEKREKGLISSGIRQIGYFLGVKLTSEDEETSKSPKPLLKPKLTITAYTSPANYPSERVLEKSGFKKVGEIQYDEDSREPDNFWILDWDELARIFAEKDEKRVEKSRTY